MSGEALRHGLLGIIDARVRDNDRLRGELSTRAIDLAALRDAVAQLADEYESYRTLKGTLHPAALAAYQSAAQRLRALIVQEDTEKEDQR